MPQPFSEIPQYVIDADATEAFLSLEPPANEAELDELAWYNKNYGKDGVIATLGAFATHRSAVADPSYPMIAMSFDPDALMFTDEELEEIGTVTPELEAEYDREQQEYSKRFAHWSTLGITSPTDAEMRIKRVRQEEGDEAAEALYVELHGPRKTDEYWAAKQARDLIYSRKLAADMQRRQQARSPEEQRQGAARVRMMLYHLATKTGPFADMDDEDGDW